MYIMFFSNTIRIFKILNIKQSLPNFGIVYVCSDRAVCYVL